VSENVDQEVESLFNTLLDEASKIPESEESSLGCALDGLFAERGSGSFVWLSCERCSIACGLLSVVLSISHSVHCLPPCFNRK
jgi:hypothetical protein